MVSLTRRNGPGYHQPRTVQPAFWRELMRIGKIRSTGGCGRSLSQPYTAVFRHVAEAARPTGVTKSNSQDQTPLVSERE